VFLISLSGNFKEKKILTEMAAGRWNEENNSESQKIFKTQKYARK
jgi:hypothetical protein